MSPQVGSVKIEGVDFKTVQDVVLNFPRKNARLRILAAIILSTSIASLSGGATCIVKEYTEGSVTASLSTNLTGTNNDLTYTSVRGGTAGNATTIAYINSGIASDALAVSVSGTAISVNLGLGAGTSQVETATVAETVPGTLTAGNATVTVTGAGITGSPLAVSVAVATNDSEATVAGKIRVALAATSAITALYTVGGSTTAVSLTEIVANGNDATLNIAIANGTCAGLTTAATSANTTAGVVPAITSTAAQVMAAVLASDAATDLVSVANKSSNDGTGIVTAMSATALAGGLDYAASVESLSSSTALSAGSVTGSRESILPTIANDIVAAGNSIALSITTGSTATTDTKDVTFVYEVLD